MNDLEFAAFETAVDVTRHFFRREWRHGQVVMNVLDYLRPDLYQQVCQTELDCFQRDERVPRLLNWLRTGVPAVPARRP